MKRVSIAALITLVLVVTSACASRGYVRKTVGDSSDALTARIETNESEIKESRDTLDRKISGVDTRVTGVDSRVSSLDAKTTEGMNAIKGDVQQVDQRTAQARSAADRAQNAVGVLDQRFQNRNQFNVAQEKNIQFKFDSAKLDEQYMSMLDETASTLLQNPDAIVVLEGRTDSVGNKDYNVKLGERRIEAVRRYLAVEKGVPVYKIHEISFGSEKPVAENKTRDGREKNRAVTMTVMTPKSEGTVASRND
jgi:outer membrane protein OmpA-like peptidoglycan-associated protein